jgi:hypothetical protein
MRCRIRPSQYAALKAVNKEMVNFTRLLFPKFLFIDIFSNSLTWN